MDRQDRQDGIGTRGEEQTLPPQSERKHPEEWSEALNPDRMAGQNIGQPRDDLPTAYELKDVNRSLQEFGDDELRKIPVVPEGERLRQGATYLDLTNPGRGEFTATAEMAAGSGERIVPKSDVPYPIWNRLRGIDDPERTP